MFWRRKTKMSVPPVVVTYKLVHSFFDEVGSKNKYELYDIIYRKEPVVHGVLNRLATLSAAMFDGYLASTQKQQEAVDEVIESYKIGEVIHEMSLSTLLYGDCVMLRDNLQFLPIHVLTIVESKDQINDISKQVFKAKYYILNEESENDRIIYEANDVIHVSLNNKFQKVTDRLGRLTFGIYSISPVEPLIPTIAWKFSITETDILWRSRNVPREVHKLDFSHVDLSKVSGSLEERISKVKSIIEEELRSYANKLKDKKPDQGWVIPKDVEIEYVEPKSVTYLKPNELVAQLEQEICIALGFPYSLLTTGAKGYASEFINSSLTSIMARMLCQKIAEALKPFVEKKSKVNGLKLKLSPAAQHERGELIRQIAVMVSTGLFTANEIRELLGYPPFEEDFIPNTDVKVTRSADQRTTSYKLRKTPIPYMKTPQSREQQQVR